MQTINPITTRRWLVRWLYAAALMHLLVGVIMTWAGNAALFNSYHLDIETSFWGAQVPAAARALQVWWFALFGATLQSYALFMWALIRLGDRHKSSTAWGWLIVAIVIWAPQDMLISWQAGIYSHLWADCFALAILLPALIWLYRHDARGQTT
jgi:hypothetical protein